MAILGNWPASPGSPAIRNGKRRALRGKAGKYRNHFSDNEKATLLRMRERGCKISEIAAALGRSYGAVKAHGDRVLKITFKFPPRKNASTARRQIRTGAPRAAQAGGV